MQSQQTEHWHSDCTTVKAQIGQLDIALIGIIPRPARIESEARIGVTNLC